MNDGESELLKRQLQELIARGADKLLLNLADLRQIDSTGLSVIAKTCARVRNQGATCDSCIRGAPRSPRSRSCAC
jgi:anti-anti-sigma factor